MKVARHASGVRRASGMAVFQTGGNLGITLGPVAAGTVLAAIGSSGGLLLLIPAGLVASLLLRDFGSLVRVRHAGSERTRASSAVDQPRAFRLLLVATGFRSVAYYGLFTFVPLWEVSQGHSKSYGTALLSLVLLSGAIGTLCSGPLADRFGQKAVLVSSHILSPPLLLVYVLAGGTVGAISVCVAGAVIVSTFSVTTVLSQEYLPTKLAMASGMSVGLAMGLGGIAAVTPRRDRGRGRSPYRLARDGRRPCPRRGFRSLAAGSPRASRAACSGGLILVLHARGRGESLGGTFGRMLDAGGGVRVVLVERLVLEQRLASDSSLSRFSVSSATTCS